MGTLGHLSVALQVPKARDGETAPQFTEPAKFTISHIAKQELPFCEWWDNGRLLVNCHFAQLLREHQLTSCRQLFEYDGGEVVRRVGSRETRRFTLEGPEEPITFYLKRHGVPAWRDRIVPWLQGARPILGARNEWEAILRFIAAGIPTMTPVAYGECNARSLLITQALPADCNLLEFIGGRVDGAYRTVQVGSASRTAADRQSSAISAATLRDLIGRVARMARKMHDAGLHHQDYYLNHMLLCDIDRMPEVRVIDLGRVRLQQPLGMRWIIKDLAQLNFSAERLTSCNRLRFLRLYLGRPFRAADRHLVRKITAKSRRIAAHTTKHAL